MPSYHNKDGRRCMAAGYWYPLPLEMYVGIPLMTRCTRYNIVWFSLSVTCDNSVASSTIKLTTTI